MHRGCHNEGRILLFGHAGSPACRDVDDDVVGPMQPDGSSNEVNHRAVHAWQSLQSTDRLLHRDLSVCCRAPGDDVLGDNEKHAIDSRTFGSVPLCDVLGKARQVYLSLGEHGVRWERIGKQL